MREVAGDGASFDDCHRLRAFSGGRFLLRARRGGVSCRDARSRFSRCPHRGRPRCFDDLRGVLPKRDLKPRFRGLLRYPPASDSKMLGLSGDHASYNNDLAPNVRGVVRPLATPNPAPACSTGATPSSRWKTSGFEDIDASSLRAQLGRRRAAQHRGGRDGRGRLRFRPSSASRRRGGYAGSLCSSE